MKLNISNAKTKLSKISAAISPALVLLAASVQSYSAAAPDGVDTTSYNSLTDIVFWLAGIAIAAAGGIPALIQIVKGQSDDDHRTRNAGIAAAIITGACVGALAAVKTVLF